MTITVNGSLLKQWWPTILVAGGLAYHTLSPELTNLATNHPHIFVWVSAGLIFAATLFKSPLIANTPNGNDTLASAIAKAKKR